MLWSKQYVRKQTNLPTFSIFIGIHRYRPVHSMTTPVHPTGSVRLVVEFVNEGTLAILKCVALSQKTVVDQSRKTK